MRIKETKIYHFEELTEDAKEKAVQNLYDINVDTQWWDCTFEDAKMIGLKITGFDIDRGAYCEGSFIDGAEDAANNSISEHGESCETYKDAASYIKDRADLVKKYSDGVNLDIVAEGNEYDFDNDCDDLDSEFLKTILEDYRIILSKEYDYLTSNEAIINTIQANEYEFTENGKLA